MNKKIVKHFIPQITNTLLNKSNDLSQHLEFRVEKTTWSKDLIINTIKNETLNFKGSFNQGHLKNGYIFKDDQKVIGVCPVGCLMYRLLNASPYAFEPLDGSRLILGENEGFKTLQELLEENNFLGALSMQGAKKLKRIHNSSLSGHLTMKDKNELFKQEMVKFIEGTFPSYIEIMIPLRSITQKLWNVERNLCQSM